LIRADTAATKLAIAGIIGSVAFALGKDSLGAFLPLTPDALFSRWALWQPLSYGFVGRGPLDVIFGAIIIWSIGSALEATWGGRKLVAFALGSTVLAGVLTLPLALASSRISGLPFFGLAVMATNIWVAYGLSYGSAQTNFWGMPVSGYTFALIGAGFVFLNGAYSSWLMVIPDVLGVLLTLFYIKVGSPRLLWLRFSSWRLHQQLKGRSKRLRVVGGDRNIGGGSDGYLH
jgi:membrane associated rhomboid family serine protease